MANSAGCYSTTTASDAELRALFKKIDLNHDELLSTKELEFAMKNMRLPRSELQLVFRSMTKDCITFNEFKQLSGIGTALQAALGDRPCRDEVQVDLGGGLVPLAHLDRERFAEFRQVLGVSDDKYYDSLKVLSGGVTQASGKSGSLFWFSGDRRYMLKSISRGEMETLLRLLPEYIEHFRAAQREGRLCLLPWFVGAYKLQDTALVAMNNVFAGEPAPERIYDLKGTTEDRFVEPQPGKVMKDRNYEETVVCLSKEQSWQLREAVRHDTLFLRKNNIMDYSLLLGVCPGAAANDALSTYDGVEATDGVQAGAAFRMGLIDVLVEYTLVKKAAHWLKKPSIGLVHEIDTEPPPFYQERFMGLIETKLTYLEGEKPVCKGPPTHRTGPPLACLAAICRC